MRIEELIKLIKNRKVSGISSNSRLVRKNFIHSPRLWRGSVSTRNKLRSKVRSKRGLIFVAVKGSKIDGSKFINEAIEKLTRSGDVFSPRHGFIQKI